MHDPDIKLKQEEPLLNGLHELTQLNKDLRVAITKRDQTHLSILLLQITDTSEKVHQAASAAAEALRENTTTAISNVNYVRIKREIENEHKKG